MQMQFSPSVFEPLVADRREQSYRVANALRPKRRSYANHRVPASHNFVAFERIEGVQKGRKTAGKTTFIAME
jgi:hypothetical protein